MYQSILQLFPDDRRKFWGKTAAEYKRIQEIRIRVDKPVVLLWDGREIFLSTEGEFQTTPKYAYCVDRVELEKLLNHLCHYSLYAYEDELRQGFLTVAGGHRIGIAGQVVRELLKKK